MNLLNLDQISPCNMILNAEIASAQQSLIGAAA